MVPVLHMFTTSGSTNYRALVVPELELVPRDRVGGGWPTCGHDIQANDRSRTGAIVVGLDGETYPALATPTPESTARITFAKKMHVVFILVLPLFCCDTNNSERVAAHSNVFVASSRAFHCRRVRDRLEFLRVTVSCNSSDRAVNHVGCGAPDPQLRVHATHLMLPRQAAPMPLWDICCF